jgi:ribosomal protein L40E
MKCPTCAEEAGKERFCRKCGSSLIEGSSPTADFCMSCGAELHPEANFCPKCAATARALRVAPLALAATVICVNCGTENSPNTDFCRSCGKAAASGDPPVVSIPGVTPDMMPTLVDASPPIAVRPSPAQVAANEPPMNSARAPGGHSRPVPRLVPKHELPVSLAATGAPRMGAARRTVIICATCVLAIVAAAVAYRYVLRKSVPDRSVTPAAPEAPLTSQPTIAPSQGRPEQATSEGQTTPTSPETQPPPDPGIEPGSEGNHAALAAGAGHAINSRPAAIKPPGAAYGTAHANAEIAFEASQYIAPPEDNALVWARKAKGLGDPEAAQIEQRVYTKLMADVNAARQAHLHEQALAQLDQVAINFPDRSEVRALQDDIRREHQIYARQIEDQRRQSELAAQTRKFPVQHRHGTGDGFCTGMISVTPDGIGHYDCNTPDSKGRCEHVTFTAESLNEVKVRGNGSLHVSTRQQGNFDFTGGEFSIRDAAASLGKLVKQ